MQGDDADERKYSEQQKLITENDVAQSEIIAQDLVTATTQLDEILENEEETRLNYELQILRSMRLAFVSSLKMLEAARDDLKNTNYIDNIQLSCERIRTAISNLREQINEK
jgi:hypothetical protein